MVYYAYDIFSNFSVRMHLYAFDAAGFYDSNTHCDIRLPGLDRNAYRGSH